MRLTEFSFAPIEAPAGEHRWTVRAEYMIYGAVEPRWTTAYWRPGERVSVSNSGYSDALVPASFFPASSVDAAEKDLIEYYLDQVK